MKRFSVVIALWIGPVVLAASPSQPRRAVSASDEVLAVENARTIALDHDDVTTLEKILADDLTYVHASGKVDTKASLLDAIRSGQVHYISWQAKTMHVRMIGDAAVLNGEYLVRVTDHRVQREPFDVNIFILAVYAKRSGHWQQIAWQSTRNVAQSPPENH
jgi:hypothetical protein